MSPVEKLRADLGGTVLDCVRFGRGDRPLVMLPGLSVKGVREAALPLAWMYRSFAKDYTVYVFDRRDSVPAGCTIRDLAEDTVRGMERLGLSQADVFGVSQGGMIAQELAIRHPALVRRLVLAVTASRPNQVMKETLARWMELARRGDWPALTVDMMERMYSASYVKKYRWLFPLLSRMGKPRDPGRFIALAEACLTCGSYPELYKITCPVLVLGGVEDRVLTGRASEEIAEKLGCEIHMYENLGHAAYDEAPDFNRRVLAFLRGG
ncbi:alpha/beta hydrolase [Acutalibacter sp. 1XD8-33]|uniref:alpha/beta fold hydrolase n=1 Tax=Acutalibacter sp. 1XD8-33 TaxID=2320081 RepID=UPI000EA2171A|nr:alpha/beta hydrolase [Acutalibacter sp. 1XD8-33]RKJ38891.1 alpha/beta hydrolase [Acutalibacter sp. 1XD8-33]